MDAHTLEEVGNHMARKQRVMEFARGVTYSNPVSEQLNLETGPGLYLLPLIAWASSWALIFVSAKHIPRRNATKPCDSTNRTCLGKQTRIPTQQLLTNNPNAVHTTVYEFRSKPLKAVIVRRLIHGR